MAHVSLVLLWTLGVLPAAAYFEANPKMIEGVPIYNYGLARLARVGQSPRDALAFVELETAGGNEPQEDDDIEWIVVMKDGVSDKQVDDLCHDKSAHGCLSEGHPDEHGIPVTGVKATIGGITKVLAHHKGEVKHVEPNLPIYVPPLEDHVEKERKQKKQKSTKGKQALLEAELAKKPSMKANAGGPYYTMQHLGSDFVVGQQYSQIGGAVDRMLALKKEGNPLKVVDGDYGQIRFSGEITEAVEKDYRAWWEKETGKKVPGPTSAPAPAPQPQPAPGPRPTPRPPPSPPVSDGDTRRRRSKQPPDDKYSWGVDRVDDIQGLDKSYESVYDGHGVHVYVLDTGLKFDHMDFPDKRAETTLEMWGTQVQECSGPQDSLCAVDRFGHGTHCAGTVGGEFSGVAKGATIHGVKVLGDDGKGSDLGVAMAVDWIMTKGKRPAVLSMSLGRQGSSKTMADVLKKAKDAGLTVVVAAGNEDSDACGNSPAFSPDVITVGATDPNDARADFSNYGECLDIFAPGKSIKSAYYAGAARFATMSGTSMACPHVAGVAALMLQANPKLTPDEIKMLMNRDGIKDKMNGSGARSPDLMLYVNPKPSWGGTKRDAPSNAPSNRRRKSKSGRRRRGSKSSRRRRRRRRRRKKKSPSPAPSPA